MLSTSGLVVLVLLFQAPAASPADFRAERDAVRTREAKALEAIAAKLDGEAAASTRALLDPPPASDGSERFVPIPEVVPKAATVEPAETKAIRLAAAKGFFEVAQKALKAKPARLALADECLRAVVARDPGHVEAYRLLGYVPHEGGWATPFALKQLKEGLVLHPTFGWVRKDWVPHLDRGELPAPSVAGQPTRWLPVAEADALRHNFQDGWKITTEHFFIQANVPLADAITFGRHLESLHDLFTSIMADVIGPEQLPLAQLARDPKLVPTPPKKRHRVYYYAEKSEYVEVLTPVQGPVVKDSLGTYLAPKQMKWLDGVGTSFFYHDPGGQLAATETLDHEVSHQLLFESAGSDKVEPERSQFWVFEGLGTYFETVRAQPDGTLRYGGIVGERIKEAQKRLMKGEFLTIGRLTSFNRHQFLGGDGGDIYLHYVESEALTVYLMHAHGGRYREEFLEYVRDVYKGKPRKGLDTRLGVELGPLNKDFQAYMKPRRELTREPGGL
jgi:hypothetical protein